MSLKISAMPSASTLDGTELFGAVQGGNNVRITGAQINQMVSTPVTVIAAAGATQNIAFATNGNNAVDMTLTANCTVNITGGALGQYQSLTLIVRQNATAGWTVTLPASVKWATGTAPTVNTSAGRIDVFVFTTPDAGTTIFGSY